jgi:desulfoferrodoxin (superoxide reductase-like protein)
MLLFVVLVLFCASFASPAFAIVPEVRNVVAYDVGGSTYLNVTVYHTPEQADHYVNSIEAIMGSNTTDLIIGVQTLNASDMFTISYDLGPVSGTPTITVKAHCNIHGWSTVNWTGQVPEFSLPMLLLIFALSTSITVLIFRKFHFHIRK